MGHNFYETMMLVFTVLKQCAKCHASLPAPPTAEHGYSDQMPNVFDRRPPPIETSPAPTVSTSLKTRSRVRESTGKATVTRRPLSLAGYYGTRVRDINLNLTARISNVQVALRAHPR
jgi:hypothetical protein